MKACLAVLSIFLCASLALAGDATVAGDLRVERPTLHCLGFEWDIVGDDNRNAAVEVTYRKAGTDAWKAALPLLRIGDEKVAGLGRRWPEVITPRMFAGSVFNLEPGTAYDVRLMLKDPDGGDTTKTLTTATKPVPKMFAGGRALHVYPADFAAKRLGPSFASLQAAYERAAPGDRVLLHAGTYHGAYVWEKDGTRERPIVIMAAGDGEVVLVNTTHGPMFDIHKADYLWFEGLTFRAPGTANGALKGVDGCILLAANDGLGLAPGCAGLVVRRCRFEDMGIGVKGEDVHCRDFTITDNVFQGRQNWTRPYGHDWQRPERKDQPDKYRTSSWVAVYLGGQGHDVAYNRVRDFWDGLAVAGHAGRPKYGTAEINASIDFYNNDVSCVDDDFLETDQGVHNIRVLRNRFTNSRTSGISAQPIYGGPAYFIGNTVYKYKNCGALKFNVLPAGLLVYHNTLIGGYFKPTPPVSNLHFRNNILIGPYDICTPTAYSSFDYDAVSADRITWKDPTTGKGSGFASLRAFAKATGQEAHGIRVDMSIFENAVEPYTEVPGFEPLAKNMRLKVECKPYDPDGIDLRPRKGTAVVDAGQVLPNVNDGYVGDAPDIGACEFGAPVPVYGPREQDKEQPDAGTL